MRYLLIAVISLCVLSSCNTNNNRFVSTKVSKEAVNTKGYIFEERISTVIPDFDTTQENSRRSLYNFQGASGRGTGATAGSMQSIQDRIKKKPESQIEPQKIENFNEPVDIGEEDLSNNTEADTVSTNHSETEDEVTWPDQEESTESDQNEWDEADWDDDDWDWE